MRFEKGHKETTRKRIIDVASKRFRKEGVSATGLAGIMAESGLTNGAFYAHFDSKDALVLEAISKALGDKLAQLEDLNDEKPDIESAIRQYLNKSHLQREEDGCPSAALLPEIARQPEVTRRAYEIGLLPYINKLAGLLPNSDSTQSKQCAIAIFSLMVGTLQIARAVSNSALAEEILEGGVQAALCLVNKKFT